MRQIEVEVTPLAQKVVLDAQVFLYYDYARGQDFPGDIGMFLKECVQFTYKKSGLKLGMMRFDMEGL